MKISIIYTLILFKIHFYIVILTILKCTVSIQCAHFENCNCTFLYLLILFNELLIFNIKLQFSHKSFFRVGDTGRSPATGKGGNMDSA